MDDGNKDDSTTQEFFLFSAKSYHKSIICLILSINSNLCEEETSFSTYHHY